MKKFHPQSYYKIQDPESRTEEVIKGAVSEILAIAKERIRKPLKELVVLDVGCGSGEYSFELEKYVKKVYGVEPYWPKYQESMRAKRKLKSKVIFYNELIENVKLKEKVDLAVSLTTVEHMPQAERSFKVLLDMLNTGGIIYLTAPNKLWPIEQHYKLPFLSWLPLSFANIYVRSFGKSNTYEDSSYARTYWGMKNLFNSLPCKYEFTLPKDPNNAYIGCTEKSIFYKFIKDFGIKLINKFPLFWFISKGFILVVIKL